MDPFEKYLTQKIDEARHFSQNAEDMAYSVAWEIFSEELEMILERYKSHRWKTADESPEPENKGLQTPGGDISVG